MHTTELLNIKIYPQMRAFAIAMTVAYANAMSEAAAEQFAEGFLAGVFGTVEGTVACIRDLKTVASEVETTITDLKGH